MFSVSNYTNIIDNFNKFSIDIYICVYIWVCIHIHILLLLCREDRNTVKTKEMNNIPSQALNAQLLWMCVLSSL